MYTPNQVSEMLSIPPSTLRRYCNQFNSHLSKHATQQRIRRYSEDDIAVLSRARELLQEGKSPQEANSLLGVISDGKQSPDKTLALIPSISQGLAEALDTARLLRAEVDTMQTTIQGHDERMSANERKLSEITAKLAQLESNQRLPWYRKIFKSSTRKT
jgi:DNA-binding transcriptional MerR regulator